MSIFGFQYSLLLFFMKSCLTLLGTSTYLTPASFTPSVVLPWPLTPSPLAPNRCPVLCSSPLQGSSLAASLQPMPSASL